MCENIDHSGFASTDDILQKIDEAWPSDRSRIRELIEVGLARDPNSSCLWCRRGDFLRLESLSTEDPYTENDMSNFFQCYKEAIRLDDDNWDAYEALGDLYDIMEDFVAAEESFRAAIQRGGGLDSFLGLARVLAQIGRRAVALDLIETASLKFGRDDKIKELRDEIVEGIWD